MTVPNLKEEMENVAAGTRLASQLATQLAKPNTAIGLIIQDLQIQPLKAVNLLSAIITEYAEYGDLSASNLEESIIDAYVSRLQDYIKSHAKDAPRAAIKWLLDYYMRQIEDWTAKYNEFASASGVSSRFTSKPPIRAVEHREQEDDDDITSPARKPGKKAPVRKHFARVTADLFTPIEQFKAKLNEEHPDMAMLLKTGMCKCGVEGIKSVRYQIKAVNGQRWITFADLIAHPLTDGRPDAVHIMGTVARDDAERLAMTYNQTRIPPFNLKQQNAVGIAPSVTFDLPEGVIDREAYLKEHPEERKSSSTNIRLARMKEQTSL